MSTSSPPASPLRISRKPPLTGPASTGRGSRRPSRTSQTCGRPPASRTAAAGTRIRGRSGSAAFRDLRFNLDRTGLANVSAKKSTAEEYLEALRAAPDFVLADPPRAGLGKQVVQRLAELKPRSLVIVSCDPATLARDLAGLIAAGYHLNKMTLVDLFPQTYHLETIVRLARGPQLNRSAS